jgi:ABC-type sugar transport system ATPase subunit
MLVAGPFRAPRPKAELPKEIALGVRPEDVRVAERGVEGEIVAVEPLGAETHLLVRFGDDHVRARVPGFDERAPGERIALACDPSKVHVFDANGEGARVA